MAKLTLDQFNKLIKDEKTAIGKMVKNELPIKAGKALVSFFQKNYRRGGFEEGGFHQWKETKRKQMGFKGVAGKYGPLLSKRNALFNSIHAEARLYAVVIKSNLPYSDIHNEGGTVTVPITKKMRGYFWYEYYRNTGITAKTSPKAKKKKLANLNPIAEMWKSMALTKKKQFRITIPQRKFIYGSPEVKLLVRDLLKKEVLRLLNANR